MPRLSKMLLLFGIAALFGALITFIALAPYLASTSWGTKQLIHFVEKTYGVVVRLDRLHLSWLGGQRVDHLAIEKEGTFQLLCPFMQTECSLWNLLRRRGAMGKTIAHQPQLMLYAAPHRDSKRQQPLWRHFQGDLFIDRAQLALTRKEEPPLTLTISSLAVTSLKVHNELRIKGEGKGKSSLLTGTFSLDIERKEAQWQGAFAITSFPVEPFYPLFQPLLSKTEFLFLQSLGKTVDLRLAMSPEDKTTSKVACTLTTPHVQAKIDLARQGALWILKEPASLQWTLSPSFTNPLADFLPIAASLQADTTLAVSINRAELAFPPSLRPQILSFEATGALERASLLIANQPCFLSTLILNAKKKRREDPLSLTLATRLRDDALPETELNVAAAVRTPVTRWQLTSLQLVLQNGPLPLIDRLALLDTALAPWLGPTLTAKLIWEADKTLKITASTPKAMLAPTTVLWDDALELKSPTTLTWIVSPAPSFQLEEPIALSVRLNALTLPFKQKGLSWKNARFDLSFTIPTIAYRDAFTLGSLTASDLTGQLTAQGKGNAELTVSSKLAFAPQTPGAALIGAAAGASLTSSFTWNRGFNAPSLLFHLTSSHLNLTLAGRLASNRFTLDRPADLALTLDPSWVTLF